MTHGSKRGVYIITLFTYFCYLYTSEVTAQSINSKGPSANIDSLLNVLREHEQKDIVYVDILNQLGFEYWTVSPINAEDYGRKALGLAEELGYKQGTAFSYRVIGVAQWVRGRHSKALENLFESQRRYTHLQDTLGIANCTMNIGLVYTDQRNYERALSNFFAAIEAFKGLDQVDRIATTYTKVGGVYTAQGRYEQALDFLTQALRIHEESGFMYGIAEVNNYIAILFQAQDENTLALQYAVRSLRLSEQIGDLEGMTKNLENIGRLHLAEKEYQKAQEAFDQGADIAKSIPAPKRLRDIYRGMRDLHLAQRQYIKAYQFFDQYEVLKDSIFNEETSAQIANLLTENELAVHQKELEVARMERDMLNTEAKYNKYVQTLLILGLLIVGGMSVMVIVAQRSRLRKKQALLEQAEVLVKTKGNLQKVELENARLKATELQRELDYKNRELTAYTLNFAQKNQLIEELKEQLNLLKPQDGQQQKQLKQLRSLVNNTRNLDRDWEDFRLHFESVHPHFFQVLKRQHPDLSNGEQKLCSLIRLNLSMKETAAILGISPNSVKTARYRLRNKLKLQTQDNLMDYLMQFDEQPAMSA